MLDLLHFKRNSLFSSRRANKRNFKLDVDWFFDGISSENEYIPFYSLIINKNVYNKKVVHYGLPFGTQDEVGYFSPLKSYPKFYYALSNYSFPVSFKTGARLPTRVYGMKGCIFEMDDNDKPNILFLLCMKSNYMLQANTDIINKNIDYSKYAIFVSTEFIMHPRFKSIYKKIYTDILLDYLTYGVEVIITNNIAKRCYKNNVKTPSFKTLDSLNEYLKAFNKQLINEK